MNKFLTLTEAQRRTVFEQTAAKIKLPVAAIEKDQLTWTHVSDLKDWKSDAAMLYAIRWIPMNFLLDPNGVILAIGLEGGREGARPR